MSKNPFTYDRDAGGAGRMEDSEFGFGPGHYPDPTIDFSENGTKSRIPIADPDHDAQFAELAAIRRMDVSDPNAQPSFRDRGNTDRFGAQPPLVRESRPPTTPKRPTPKRRRMERQW